MSAYTTIIIGGVDVYVDPDTIATTNDNIIAIDRSLGGTSYVTSIKSNSPAVNGHISISGVLLPADNAYALQQLSSLKTAIQVEGSTIVDPAKNFIVMSVTTDPTKPLQNFGDSTDGQIKYRYSITLQEVD